MKWVMQMNKLALWHKAKSEFSYAYDNETLHIILRTARNDFSSVEIIYGDPFSWISPNTWKNEISKMRKRYQTSDFDYYWFEIKPQFLRVKYAFLLKYADKTFLFGAKRLLRIEEDSNLYGAFDLSQYYNFPYLNFEDLHNTPNWVKDTVWYQIFPDRFYTTTKNNNLKWGSLPVSNDQLFGGNLAGVIKKIPYLKSLGITGIYFTPIFESPSAHKYDTTNYFKIDPQFGTNKIFKELVKTAHENDMKVMLDGVFNHCGYDHKFFQDVIKNGEDSKYRDCFFIDEFPIVNYPVNALGKPVNYGKTPLNFKAFAFTPYMPKWNTNNKIVSDYLLKSISYWIKEFDIDGWRLDVSNEISHDFLRKIKKVSRDTKKDTFILGENWDSSYPWLHGDQMDSVMNYDLSDILWKFVEHKVDLKTFKNLITSYFANTPDNIMETTFNLVGSHDTVRIKRRLDDDHRRVKLIYLLMFLSAGSPSIYYGDEIGITGNHDPDNRRCMIWNKNLHDLDFMAFVRLLIKLRDKHPSFKSCDYHFIDSSILVFTKHSKNNEILILINNGEKQSISIPKNISGNYRDLLKDVILSLCDKITLDTYDFLILQKETY